MLLPMIVDAECGMPLDLGKWEALWEDGADDHGARTARTPLPPTNNAH
jgi:RNA polymerase II-associated factor 1